jgi:hypothetical protein
LKDVENDKLIAPDGTGIKYRLRFLVTRTADDIKLCSNVCDAYVKKRLLVKVTLAQAWDAKLLGFVRLFNHRRREFEFELSIHIGQGVNMANAKLDAVGHETHTLNEKSCFIIILYGSGTKVGRRMATLVAMFQQLVSLEQQKLSELVTQVTANGGVKALRNNDRMLLALEETSSRSSSTPSAEGHRALRAKVGDMDDLKNDIFEDPGAAVEKNRDVFFHKFELQKNQIIEELKPVVERDSDRVIKEVKGGPHERIRDRVGHLTLHSSTKHWCIRITYLCFSRFMRYGKIW